MPARLITIGNVAAPSLVEVATMPTEATVPVSLSVVASVVMATAWPALRLARSALPTLPSSFQVLVEITTNWAVLAVDVVDALELEELLELPLPVTVSPSSRLTLATVPLMGERSTASSRFVLAWARAAFAEVTCALAEVIAALLPSLSYTSERLASCGGQVGLGQVDGVLPGRSRRRLPASGPSSRSGRPSPSRR